MTQTDPHQGSTISFTTDGQWLVGGLSEFLIAVEDLYASSLLVDEASRWSSEDHFVTYFNKKAEKGGVTFFEPSREYAAFVEPEKKLALQSITMSSPGSIKIAGLAAPLRTASELIEVVFHYSDPRFRTEKLQREDLAAFLDEAVSKNSDFAFAQQLAAKHVDSLESGGVSFGEGDLRRGFLKATEQDLLTILVACKRGRITGAERSS